MTRTIVKTTLDTIGTFALKHPRSFTILLLGLPLVPVLGLIGLAWVFGPSEVGQTVRSVLEERHGAMEDQVDQRIAESEARTGRRIDRLEDRLEPLIVWVEACMAEDAASESVPAEPEPSRPDEQSSHETPAEPVQEEVSRTEE